MTFFKKPKKLIEKKESVKGKSNLTEKKGSEDEEINICNQEFTLLELLDLAKEPFSASDDMITQWINLPSNNSKMVILFINSIIDKEILQKKVIDPFFVLKQEIGLSSFDEISQMNFKKHHDIKESKELLLQSNALIFNEDTSCYYSVFAPIETKRDITEPDNESIIRGSHDGFIEDMTINLALIRKQIKNPKLTVKYVTLGKETHTKIAIVYVENSANPDYVKEVERRIKSIEEDAIYVPGNIEESIEDKPFSFFPQMLNTERPDRVASNLIEGRIALVYDTSPTVHVMPVTFFTFYQSVDDYNKRWHIGSFFRLIRLFSFFIAIGLPAVYIAIVAFHFEVIPFGLVLLIKSSLEDIPYPPLIEALLMELTIELIREASIRLPTRIGSTIAIVGGLVIGDAVVKAGLVSNLMIIVVAVTAIAAYIVPSNEMSAAVRILRFPFMIAAATLGFVGIVFGFMILFFHLCRLNTFGSPYFSPVAPLRLEDLRDTFIRVPFWKMNTRPKNTRSLRESRENNTRKWDKT